MDIAQLGAIGELVGGLAVIGSLLYVGVQVRAQTQESRLASVHSLNVAYGTYLDTLIESKEVREVYLQGLGDFEGLELEQRLLFSACLGKAFRFHESAFHQWRAGRIDADTWKTFNQPFADLLNYPGLRTWWTTRSDWYGERFQAHIESLIQRREDRDRTPYPRD